MDVRPRYAALCLLVLLLGAAPAAAQTGGTLLGTVLGNLGFICEVRGRYADGLAFLAESLEIRRAMGDIGGIALSLLNIGVIHERHGDYQRAKAYYSESMEHYASIGDQPITPGPVAGVALVPSSKPRATEAARAGP